MVMLLLMVVSDVEVVGSGRTIAMPFVFVAIQVILATPSSDSTIHERISMLPSNTPVLPVPLKFMGAMTANEDDDTHVKLIIHCLITTT